MKKYLILALAVALVTVLVPMAVYARTKKAAAPKEPATAASTQAPDEGAEGDAGAETVAVFMSDTGRVETLSMRDYIICVVAGEMPAAYEPEALKAQALVSVTLTRWLQAGGTRDASLSGGEISTDPKRHQAYMSVSEMQERWGDNFDGWYEKLCNAVDAVLPLTVTYEGKPIMAVFHAVSSGVTETAETVWGKEIPYLVSCDSAGDKLSPGYASEARFSPEALREKLDLPASDLPPADWLGEGTYTAAGTLTGIEICGVPFTGAALREALGLRSAAVKPAYEDGEFVFRVTGYGHGVGMSQYGADYLARQGMDCNEIIAHYYPGTEVVELGVRS